jgi:Anthrone oxygenase
MLLKITRFVSLSLMGLGTGVSFSHLLPWNLLQWKRKAELPGEVFVRVQKSLYNAYGPTGVIIEPGELLSTLATLALLRKRRTPALLTSLALLTVLTKFPVWALFIRPINGQMLGWTEESFPPNWEELRDRWHRLHLLRFVLSAVGTSALLAGSLADTPTSSRASGRRK